MINYLVIAALICSAVMAQTFFVETPDESGVLPQATAVFTPRPTPTPTPLPHPVSLPALFDKQFDGGDFQLGKILARHAAYTRYAITYRSAGLLITGVMNVPKGDGPFPVILTAHGYIPTSTYKTGTGLRREHDLLARRGYIVLHPDFRDNAGSDKVPDDELKLRLGYAEDAINAVLALQRSELHFVDRENIGMLGHSMGGGVVQHVMVIRPDLAKAYVIFAGASMDARDVLLYWDDWRPGIARQVRQTYGDPSVNQKFWDDASASTFVSRVTAPLVIHQGDRDSDILPYITVRTQRFLSDAGKQVIRYVYPGQGHTFGSAWPQVMERSIRFFDAHLKGKVTFDKF